MEAHEALASIAQTYLRFTLPGTVPNKDNIEATVWKVATELMLRSDVTPNDIDKAIKELFTRYGY